MRAGTRIAVAVVGLAGNRFGARARAGSSVGPACAAWPGVCDHRRRRPGALSGVPREGAFRKDLAWAGVDRRTPSPGRPAPDPGRVPPSRRSPLCPQPAGLPSPLPGRARRCTCRAQLGTDSGQSAFPTAHAAGCRVFTLTLRGTDRHFQSGLPPTSGWPQSVPTSLTGSPAA